jgi:hypothetical protein
VFNESAFWERGSRLEFFFQKHEAVQEFASGDLFFWKSIIVSLRISKVHGEGNHRG